MLVRIPVDKLLQGMFIHEFCGSWFDHPFWRTSFLLDSPEDLRTVLSTGIKEVWIDTDKGLDAEGGKVEKTVATEIDNTLAKANTGSKIAATVSVAKEAVRASKIFVQSKEEVSSMFQEVRMGKALKASDAMPAVEEISSSVIRNPGALISLARLKDKDNYTYMHSVAVCALMVALARQLELNKTQIHQAGLAGLMHDIGKTQTPLKIINKSGKLSESEFEVVRHHPMEGYKILLESHGMSEIVLDVCLSHHEKVDGNGYPRRLAHDQINMYARMCTICDVYDAITSVRAYKSAWEPAEAIRRMAEWSEHFFDLYFFQTFVKVVGIYPIGSLVRLASDRLGVVIDQSEGSLLTPRLMVFFSIKTKSRMTPELLDLSKPYCRDKIVSHEDPGKWDVGDTQEMWSGLATEHHGLSRSTLARTNNASGLKG